MTIIIILIIYIFDSIRVKLNQDENFLMVRRPSNLLKNLQSKHIDYKKVG